MPAIVVGLNPRLGSHAETADSTSRLKQLLLEMALNFDHTATNVLCLQPERSALLYKQFLQAKPLSQDLSWDAVEDRPIFTEAEDQVLLDGLAKAAELAKA